MEDIQAHHAEVAIEACKATVSGDSTHADSILRPRAVRDVFGRIGSTRSIFMASTIFLAITSVGPFMLHGARRLGS
jgi:hypothetical protein